MFGRCAIQAALIVAVYSMTLGGATAAELNKKQAKEAISKLQGDSTADEEKRAICRQLGLIGEAADVPALAALLDSESLMLDALAEAINLADGADEKCELLAEVAKIEMPRALSLAAATAASAAHEDVAKEATAVAARIAEVLLSAEQPVYVRRSAFQRWVASLPAATASKTLTDALSGDDVVQQSAAMGFIRREGDGALIASLVERIASFPASTQAGLMDLLISRGAAEAVPALAELSQNAEKKIAVMAIDALGTLGGEKALAAVDKALGDADEDVRAAAVGALGRWGDASSLPALLDLARKTDAESDKILALGGIATLSSVAQADAAARAKLLEALTLAVATPGDEAAAAAVGIAEALAAAHPTESREALDTLAARKLGEDAQQRVRAAILSFDIDKLTNLAKGAKASSPDGLDMDGPHTDADAIDGDQATYWDKTDNHPLYRFRVDLAEETDVSAISIVGWAHHSFSPKDFEIVCDEKVVRTVKNAVYSNNRYIACFSRTRCKSIELKITGHYGGSPCIRELGIHDGEKR